MPPFLFLLSTLLLTGAIVAGIKSTRPLLKFTANIAAFLFAGTTAFSATYLISPPKHISALDEPIQSPHHKLERNVTPLK